MTLRGVFQRITCGNLATLVRRPLWSIRRIRKLLYEARHPSDPWIAPGTVRLLAGTIDGNSRILEFGSGRSTVWFAHRSGWVVSVEHDAAWHARVVDMVTAAGVLPRTDLRLVGLRGPGPEPDESRDDYLAAAADQDDASVDVVLVDGLYRVACVATCLPKVRPGGLLIIDNANWIPEHRWGVPASWEKVDESDFYGDRTVAWRRPNARISNGGTHAHDSGAAALVSRNR